MKTLKDYKTEQMKDTEFVKEYESIQPEMDVIRAIVEARTSQNLTQKDLPNARVSIRLISVNWKMELETLP